MTRLFLGGGGGGTSPAAGNINLVVDGNSIYANYYSEPYAMDHFIVDALPAGAVVSATSVALSAQSWLDMRTMHDDTDAAWVQGRRNILVASETTNSIFNTGKTAAQVKTEVAAYIDSVLIFHPWQIVLVGSIPRGFTSADAAKNLAMREVDAWMGANYASLGAVAYADLHGIAMFNNAGTSMVDHDAYAAAWFDTIHPNGVGKALMGSVIADAIAAIL